MAKMVWDNNNQCYTITAANVGPKYNITISSAENHAFLGNVNINLTFKKYVLKDSYSITKSSLYNSGSIPGGIRFYWDSTSLAEVLSTANNEGLLLDNNKQYPVTISFGNTWYAFKVVEMNPISTGHSTGDSYTCKTEPKYIYFYKSLRGGSNNYGIPCHFERSHSGGTSRDFTVNPGGCIFHRYNQGLTIWYYRQSATSDIINLGAGTVTILGSTMHTEDMLEFKIEVV